MNIQMMKNVGIWALELAFTFTLFGYNISIGSTFYNWFAALFGGFMYFWLMYFDEDTSNKAALKMAFFGPGIAVIIAPIICEYYGITLNRPLARAVYMLVSFFGLTTVTILYSLSKSIKKEAPSIIWRIIRKKTDPK